MIEITRIIMGMPITIAVAEPVDQAVIDATFDLFVAVDEKFSTYRAESEISRFNNGELREEELSTDVHHVFALARQTEKESRGYFNMQKPDGRLDPSGIVKGWAIARAVAHLHEAGLKNFFIDAGGDVQSSGVSGDGTPWRVGIRSPFHLGEIIKVLEPAGAGVATSGSTIRGAAKTDLGESAVLQRIEIAEHAIVTEVGHVEMAAAVYRDATWAAKAAGRRGRKAESSMDWRPSPAFESPTFRGRRWCRNGTHPPIPPRRADWPDCPIPRPQRKSSTAGTARAQSPNGPCSAPCGPPHFWPVRWQSLLQHNLAKLPLSEKEKRAAVR